MLADAGARLVILGHSERRAGHGETDAHGGRQGRGGTARGTGAHRLRRRKPRRTRGRATPWRWSPHRSTARCRPRWPGDAFAVAYEPVWAIGSGLTPTSPEIEAMHAAIRARSGRPVRRRGRRGSDPLRRLGQAGQRRRNPPPAPRSAAPWSAGASLKAADFEAIIRRRLTRAPRARRAGLLSVDQRSSHDEHRLEHRRRSAVRCSC